VRGGMRAVQVNCVPGDEFELPAIVEDAGLR
jgi:hypothetical protein